MKFLKLLLGGMLAISLLACGGGGGSAGSTGVGGTSPDVTTPTPGLLPASVDIQASANELLSAGTEITVTVVVKSASNVGMPNQAVSFSTDVGTLKGVSAATNDDGIATAKLSAGSKVNQNVTVTVSAGTATGQITLPVVGTRLTVTGPAVVKTGQSQAYTARLVDSAGNPIRDAALSGVSVLAGNVLGAFPRTDSNGVATFLYTANVSGTDTLTVSGLGAVGQLSIAANGADLSFLSPGSDTVVAVNSSQAISIQYLSEGLPVSGAVVQFSASRGLLSAQSATTNAQGSATVQITSASSGPAIVTARIPDVGQIVLPLTFAADTPATLILQANPGAVFPNVAGSSANRSVIEATVRDAFGNAVADRLVNFNILSDDGNGGRLTEASSLTDANGRAQVQFVPGSTSTEKDGVKIAAAVAGTGVTGTAVLTVNGEALNINIGYGNTIANLDDTSYIKQFSVFVTDVSGAPVVGQRVDLSTSPVSYIKGQLTQPTLGSMRWGYGSFVVCPNEDFNRNGRLDDGEDLDGDGDLTPGNPIVVSPGFVTTDAVGRATFSLIYGEQFAPWLTVELLARARVGGTESESSVDYFVGGLDSDFNSATPPAGVISPFGTTLSCSSK